MESIKKIFKWFVLGLLLAMVFIYGYYQTISASKTITVFQKIGATGIVFRKVIGHFSVNLIIAFLLGGVFNLFNIRKKLVYLLIGLFLALSFELLQLLAINRVFSIMDIIINFSSYLLIFCFWKLCEVILFYA